MQATTLSEQVLPSERMGGKESQTVGILPPTSMPVLVTRTVF